ncbi:hypothetical protein [Mycobacterium montefiorense]|uniref:Uncharacterized protein n=1 Tax=Mycobacterium montefiorense TaxID=154654 RepID=A0AA37PPJ4_9MYCO|nr:hypothetical protein [Mycobacterium montefiorense]GBG36854.1 hypothetical protein MmonteBS_12260 [Mycobacterium montefiorense]GKU37761.1 hypothetical protein NJB14191_51070 [Mycobacterium montefiorense]GKU42719.1 hypothetical protein NJB14192_47020 [Mycobacterium montefiorense]GKU46405.1 hypothetical protein NJB14194_30240 [Mycobacterium montefiorense]GKU51012.1 hypothetical protein NJB14195_22580 [Mycobacterium montefiorense]
MNLAWLAAVLSPFEIAAHPNFGSSGGFRPEEDLAAIVLGRIPSWEQFERRIAPPEEEGPPVDEAVRLVYDAIYKGGSAIEQFFETVLIIDGGDVARSTALTLLACVLAGMDDNHDLCERLVSNALQMLAVEDGESVLCRAALLQQRALRRRDVGQQSEDDSIEVASTLEALDVKNFETFSTNGVTTRSCSAVLDDIRKTLIRASWSTVSSSFFSEGEAVGPIPSRRDQLFVEPTERLTKLESYELEEYYRYVERAYDRLLRQIPQTVWGGRPPDIFLKFLLTSFMVMLASPIIVNN